MSSLIFEINETNKNKNKSKINKTEEKQEKQEINNTQNEINYNKINKNDNKDSNIQNKKYRFTRKVQRKDYTNNIIKKKNLLKLNNVYNNNFKFLSLYTNSKKKIPKSKSFNYAQNCNYNSNVIKTEINRYKFNPNFPSNYKKQKIVLTPQINQNKIQNKINIEKNKNK